MAEYGGLRVAANGLSDGMDPSGLILRNFPRREFRFCASAGTLFSPTTMYNIPSGPNWMIPPLWILAVGILSKMIVGVGLVATVFPFTVVATKRATRLFGRPKGV